MERINETYKQLLNNCRSIKEELESTETSIYEWLEDALEIQYITNMKKEYIGSEILLCCGGPTIRVNTKWNQIEGFWGGDEVTISYENNELDEILEEYYNM